MNAYRDSPLIGAQVDGWMKRRKIKVKMMFHEGDKKMLRECFDLVDVNSLGRLRLVDIRAALDVLNVKNVTNRRMHQEVRNVLGKERFELLKKNISLDDGIDFEEFVKVYCAFKADNNPCAFEEDPMVGAHVYRRREMLKDMIGEEILNRPVQRKTSQAVLTMEKLGNVTARSRRTSQPRSKSVTDIDKPMDMPVKERRRIVSQLRHDRLMTVNLLEGAKVPRPRARQESMPRSAKDLQRKAAEDTDDGEEEEVEETGPAEEEVQPDPNPEWLQSVNDDEEKLFEKYSRARRVAQKKLTQGKQNIRKLLPHLPRNMTKAQQEDIFEQLVTFEERFTKFDGVISVCNNIKDPYSINRAGGTGIKWEKEI